MMNRSLSPFSTPRKYFQQDLQQPSIFEKLTDSKLYTGTHKHRFSNNGKGLGKQGRIDPACDKKSLEELVFRR